MFQNKENVRGLLEIIANDLVDLIDFNQSVECLKQLILDASLTPSFEAFQRTLDA